MIIPLTFNIDSLNFFTFFWVKFMRYVFCLFFVLLHCQLFGEITYKVLKGKEIAPYVAAITKLCHTVYKEYPYLYDAEEDDYTYYLGQYSESENSIICFAFDGEQPIGMASGIPLKEYRSHYVLPFINNGYDLTKIFYLGELILLKDYRGNGVGKYMYLAVEQNVRDSQNYTLISFSQIDESFVKAVKPDDYVNINGFWEKLGFVKHPELSYNAVWRDIGESEYSKHPMFYWTKDL